MVIACTECYVPERKKKIILKSYSQAQLGYIEGEVIEKLPREGLVTMGVEAE